MVRFLLLFVFGVRVIYLSFVNNYHKIEIFRPMRLGQGAARTSSYTVMGTSVSIPGRCVTGHSSVTMGWMNNQESVQDSKIVFITTQAE